MKRLIAFVLLMLLAVCPALAEDTVSHYRVGDPIADFTLTTWDGIEFNMLKALEEKDVVIIHFWAGWCGACEEEMILFRDIFAEYGDRVALIAVATTDDHTEKALRTYCTRRDITYLVAQDTAGLTDAFSVRTLPSTMVVDKEGVLREVKQGALTGIEEFAALVEAYLAPLDAADAIPVQE